MKIGLLIVGFMLLLNAYLFCAEGDGGAVAVDASNLPIVLKCRVSSVDGPDADKLRHFEVLCEAMPIQELKDGGIRLNITVHNKLAEAVVIENPVDYFTYTLRNSAGASVAFPRPQPRAEATSLKGPREPRKLAFVLLGMALDGQKLDADSIDLDTVKLAPGAKLSFSVLIDKLAKGAPAKPEETQAGTFEAGRYGLRLRVAILLHHEDGSAWFDTPPYDDPDSLSIKLK